MYVRVRDTTSGHEFDAPENDWRIGSSLELVNKDSWPPSEIERPPIFKKPLGGAAVRAKREAAATREPVPSDELTGTPTTVKADSDNA